MSTRLSTDRREPCSTYGTSVDVMIGAHFLRITFLVCAVAENIHFRTQRLGEQERIMAQSSETDDTDFLARPASVSDQGREHGQSSAQHRASMSALNLIRNREDELGVGDDASGITTHRLDTIGELGAIGMDHAGTIVLIVSFAGTAFHAGKALCTDTGTIADFDVFHVLADASDLADNFMTE